MYPIIKAHLAEISKVMLADQLPSCIPQQLSKQEHTLKRKLPHHITHACPHLQIHISQWEEVFVCSVLAAESAITHTHTF